ncbi:MAG: hypothetical protein AAF242_14955, partial [Bacteroidota bacterium]
PGLALAFSNKRNHLLNRVKRILNHPINKNNIMEKFSITSLVLLCLLVFSVKEYTEQREDFPPEQETQVEKLPTLVLDEIVLTGYQSKKGINTWTEQPEIKRFTIDTLPQGKVNISTTRNGEKIEAKLRGGKIQELKINGVVQPASAYEAYLPIFEEIATPPPPPPAPMAPPAFTPNAPPPPPGAPTPPPAPQIKLKGKVSIKTVDDTDGNAVIYISTDDGREPVEIKVKGDQKEKVVIVNGEVMETEGELIMIDEDRVIELAPSITNGMSIFKIDGSDADGFLWVDSLENNFASFNYSSISKEAYVEKLKALEEALANGEFSHG